MMIERYTRDEMGELWSDKTRLQRWLDVEIAACRALEKESKVPAGTADAIARNAKINIDRILEIEKDTHHDVVAFTQMITEQLGDEGRWLHYGLTSSDIVDTAVCTLIRDALKIIIKDFKKLAEIVKKQAEKHKYLVMIGRTHGVHAEPTTLGLKFALWYSEILRDIRRLERAEETISYGKLSGPVGTFAHLEPSIEEHTCKLLELKPASVSSQIVQRDRHAEVMTTLAICASSLEKFSIEIRHLQRTEVRELEEPFGNLQKGSSSMPHKRNPVKSENVSGLARIIKSYALAALDNVALWHERDISHSSVERVIFPDAFIVLDFITDRFTKIVKDITVYPENISKNLHLTKGLVFSGTILLSLVEKGLSRENAYSIVQENAMKAWEGNDDFRSLLLRDNRVTDFISQKEIDRIFDSDKLLKNVDVIFSRVFSKK